MGTKKVKAGNYRKSADVGTILNPLDEFCLLKYREWLVLASEYPSIDSAHAQLTRLGLTTVDKIIAVDAELKKYR